MPRARSGTEREFIVQTPSGLSCTAITNAVKSLTRLSEELGQLFVRPDELDGTKATSRAAVPLADPETTAQAIRTGQTFQTGPSI